MGKDCCVHELPKADGERKLCKHGEGIECKFCHVAHPEILNDFAMTKDTDDVNDDPMLLDATE